MKRIIGCLILLIFITGGNGLSAQRLEKDFKNPPMQYRPYVWWHWMGPNFSLQGITKDLEAMRDAGIGGATIFNLCSAVEESISPTTNNPWPEQTYRSEAYWKAIRFACSEAERLGIEIGLHNTAGYSTTGGPWIDEDKGMKHLVSRKVKITGGKEISVDLPQPVLPPYPGWGAAGKITPDKYDEIAVLAVPCKGNILEGKVFDLKSNQDNKGHIVWDAPAGEWFIFRIGYASSMATPHPVPDDLIGKTLEVNKIDSALTAFHWDQVLNPLKEHVGDYFGKSFKHLLIDSYEAGNQNWTKGFRETFIKWKGYDPVEWLPCLLLEKGDTLQMDTIKAIRFKWDFNDVVARMYQLYGWKVAKDKIAAMNLQLQHEPYWGPFSIAAGAALDDLPMGEFWTHSDGKVDFNVPAGGRAGGHTVIGAEAYTSSPDNSKWTEDPAFLKKTTEGAFASGVNHMAMHQWVLQPFDDRYQPGMGMGWWGTHFSRHQPWIKPGKAFFEYVTRSQYLLQQGEQVIDFLALDEVSDQITDAMATIDFLDMKVNVKDRHIVLSSGRKYVLMQFSQGKAMLPEVLDKIGELLEHGAIIVAQKPEESLSLTNYPACDEYIKSKAETLWKKYAGKQIFSKREDAMLALCLTPDYQVFEGDAQIVHRHSPEAEIYYIGNLTDKKQTVTVSLRIKDMYPELWNAQTGLIEHIDNMKNIDNSGNMVKGAYWSFENNRTLIRMTLLPYQSHFIVMRRKATAAEIETGSADKPALTKYSTVQLRNGWNVHFGPKLDKTFDIKMDTLSDFNLSTDGKVKYFTGTATYSQTITISQNKLSQASQIWFDLDSMNDIAVLKINGISVDTLWYPPYRTEITRYLKKGKNAIEVLVTNNWANRMIGDEQYPADFEWGKDRGVDLGRAMKGYPEWFLKGQPRPQKGRKAFAVWYYHRKDSPLQKAGLVGPVNMEFWK